MLSSVKYFKHKILPVLDSNVDMNACYIIGTLNTECTAACGLKANQNGTTEH